MSQDTPKPGKPVLAQTKEETELVPQHLIFLQ